MPSRPSKPGKTGGEIVSKFEQVPYYYQTDTVNRGQWICYTGKPCKKCKRNRVDVWENGDNICEKCSYNQKTDEFEANYRRPI